MLTPIERLLVRLAASRPAAWVFVNLFTHIDRLLVRASHGRLSTAVGTRFHSHIILLRTVGARTSQPPPDICKILRLAPAGTRRGPGEEKLF
jgi:hypothetical protein